MQGAVDGGLDIPHSVKRFPGTNFFLSNTGRRFYDLFMMIIITDLY
jgi:hypothetical protein